VLTGVSREGKPRIARTSGKGKRKQRSATISNCLRNREERRLRERPLTRALAARLQMNTDAEPLKSQNHLILGDSRAGATGLEPATSGVTGRVRYDDASQRTPPSSLSCRFFEPSVGLEPHS
jgi:hypothetical protein